MMSSLTERVADVARSYGADVVGFAPIHRFDNAPRQNDPRSVFPQTRTVIAMAVRQPRGAFKAVEEGCYWQAYNCDSYWYLNEVLAPSLLRAVVMFLEEQGHTSVPFHNPFGAHAGRQIRADQPAGPDGMASLRVIGVAAGLGELGLSKIFLTPEFGPRQRVFAVFTDAELTPTPLFTGKVCDECGLCARECEAGAISTTRDVKFTIEGVEFAHGELDATACAVVHRGDDPRFSPFWTGKESEGQKPAYNAFLDHRFRHRSICVGRGCLRVCLDHLEKTGRISAQFKTPMISGRRWKLNEPLAKS